MDLLYDFQVDKKAAISVPLPRRRFCTKHVTSPKGGPASSISMSLQTSRAASESLRPLVIMSIRMARSGSFVIEKILGRSLS